MSVIGNSVFLLDSVYDDRQSYTGHTLVLCGTGTMKCTITFFGHNGDRPKRKYSSV